MKSRVTMAVLAVVLGLGIYGEQAGIAQEREGGFRVHGRWMIEVRDADGAVASRTEFENALTPEGGAALISGLAGRGGFSSWRVTLRGVAVPIIGGTFEAVITQRERGTAADPAGNLSISVGSSQYTTLLAGETTFAQARDIRDVDTQSKLYNAQLQVNSYFTPFTAKRLPSPIRVAAGQVVRVEVSISFASTQ